MLEAFGQQENFFGRDPMKWWIGQVTDPDKGKWGDSLEKKRAEDNEDIYAFRCRVRIVGYHGSDSDLKDEELPLAHVLLPSNTTTVGGCGATLQYQGGEVVVGFFADGDDAQQPIIFGTLFKQSYIPDKKTNQKFNASPFTDFEPYTPPKVVQRSGKSRFNDQEWIPQSPPIRAFSDGESVKVAAQKQKEASTNISVDSFSPCEDNEISKISSTIKSFTRKLQTLQELNEGATYIDPVFGGTVDLQQEIKQTTNRVHDSMTKLVRRGRSWLVQDTLDKLSSTLKDKTPKTLQAPVGQATKSLSDVIFCNLEKIQEGLKDYLSKSFENMIGQVLDVPACGIENFLGDMFGQIDNAIDSGLGSMFEQLNNINGGGLAVPSDAFKKGIRFANIITNVLDCDSLNCPEPTAFSAKNGVAKAVEDSFEGILANSGLSQLNNLAEDIENIGNAIPASPTRPDCNTNVLECGPPRVDFIGGGGQGASGSAIVNALGNIIGVSINGPGFGYKEPPLLSFFDSCDKGYGAGGYAVMGPVSPLTNRTSVAAGAVGGLPVTSNGLSVSAGGVGGVPVTTPNGQQVTTSDGTPIVVGGLGGKPVTGGGIGGSPLSVGGKPIVINGQGGEGLVAGAFPVTIGGSATGAGAGGAGGAGAGGAGGGGGGAGGIGGGTGAGAGDINTSLISNVPEISQDSDDGAKTGTVTSIGSFSSSEEAYSSFTTLGAIAGNGSINGTGATFDIFTDKNGNIESIVINSGGGSYQVGETITILGSLLGGSSPENNVTFEVAGISSPRLAPPVTPQLPPPVAAGVGGVDAGAAGGIDANTPSFTGFNITAGGEPNVDGLYLPDPNGGQLGVVNVVITDPGQEYLPNTTETSFVTLTDDDGNPITDNDGNEISELTTRELTPNPNANYDGEQSFVTSLGDVVVTNTGFGYEDGDTVTVSGGGIGDGTDAGDVGSGSAEVELEIQDGRIIGAKVTNGGFGFTNLPDLTINSESGVGGRLLPVLNFTKVQDVSKLVESERESVIMVINCITK
mgnify:CR=1 FL=1